MVSLLSDWFWTEKNPWVNKMCNVRSAWDYNDHERDDEPLTTPDSPLM